MTTSVLSGNPKIYECSVCGEYYFESENGPLTEDYVCTNCGANYMSFIDITDEYNSRKKD
jgi:formylmethanofuran dehydrogenase subunit E